MNYREMLFGEIQRMSHIGRYSSYAMNRRENVAEHCWYVSFYSLLLAEDIRKHFPITSIDMGKLLKGAILHDVDEALTGDFVRTVKYSSKKMENLLFEAASDAVFKLLDHLDVPNIDKMHDAWESSKTEGLEGKIMHFADMLAVFSYLWQEIQSGNQIARGIMKECSGWIVKLWSSYDDQAKEYFVPCMDSLDDFTNSEMGYSLWNVPIPMIPGE